jgi:hypothetical protein
VKGFLGTVVVENQGGAGGSTGTAAVARAQPDGYTILLGGTTVLVVNPAASSRSFYDPIKDFVPIAILGTNPGSITVRPTQPIRTLNELVAYAKTNPGKLSYGSSGVGTINHLVGERLKLLTGTDIAHIHNSVRAGFLIGACVGSCCLLRPAIGRSRADLADWRDPHGHRRTHRSVTAEAATTAATDHIGGGPEQRTGGLYRIWGWPLILMGKPEP